jgi:hypothetical protein
MTLEEFSRQLEGIGQAIEETPSALTQLGDQIINSMRARVPIDTGALRNSLRYIVEGNDLQFSMLDYGQFQNYGVRGESGPSTNPVPFGVEPQPSSPPFYTFKSRSFGIRPQPFYDYDEITNQIVEALQNRVNEI